jgi:hypothetical protein
MIFDVFHQFLLFSLPVVVHSRCDISSRIGGNRFDTDTDTDPDTAFLRVQPVGDPDFFRISNVAFYLIIIIIVRHKGYSLDKYDRV